MSCEKGTCEHNAYQITLRKLKAENQALLDELAAVKQEVLDTLESGDITYNNLCIERDSYKNELAAVKAEHDAMEITYMTTKQSLNKIKADAIQSLIAAKFTNVYIEGLEWPVIYVEDAHAYANQVEKG